LLSHVNSNNAANVVEEDADIGEEADIVSLPLPATAPFGAQQPDTTESQEQGPDVTVTSSMVE
jgi:hypothetical protein